MTLSSVSNILAQYRADKGRYPTDGWKNELQYVASGSEDCAYDLFSLGAYGQQGSERQDADLYAQL
ncbi:MAG: type II secretion system protein GspG [Psychrobacter sp.]